MQKAFGYDDSLHIEYTPIFSSLYIYVTCTYLHSSSRKKSLFYIFFHLSSSYCMYNTCMDGWIIDHTWQSICIDWIYKERKAMRTF